jgi:hypothetical protein
MALLSGAIKLIGDKGLASDEQVSDLYATLDRYKAKPTEDNMKKVQTAFENTGISANTFIAIVGEAITTLDPTVQKETQKSISTLRSSSKDLKSTAKTSYENIPEGAKEGIDNKSKDVSNAAKDMTGDTFTAIEDEADSHSPSKRAETIGEDIGEGLKLGLEGADFNVSEAAKSLMKSAFSAMSDMVYDFGALGTDIGEAISYSITAVDFYTLGTNIGQGIYNGLSAAGGILDDLAWNTAINMFNSACAALGIASPSKKFAWIGQMVVEGLGNSVYDNSDTAVDAVTDLADSMSEEAEKLNPSVSLDTSITNWIDNLDNVLTRFSTIITDRFDNLTGSITQIGNLPAIPAVAQGKVIPSSIQVSKATEENNSVLKDMIQSLAANQMSYDELRALLVEMFSTYMNLSWTINDEQLARHVNNGNSSLHRRYNTV